MDLGRGRSNLMNMIKMIEAQSGLTLRLGIARLSLKLSAKKDAKPVLEFVRDTGRLRAIHCSPVFS
jgi:hypothetical protein